MVDEAAMIEDRERRMKWWHEARFGMFIHWGLYAQIGRGEWAMNVERIPVEEYEKLADTWHPMPGAPRIWAKLARRAGMRYMVMTTKHHEGFLLWDSELSDYNAKKRGPGRDLVAEYVEAARAEGLGVGFYYSLMDWHHPDGAACKNDEAARRRFVDYSHGLVRELCSNYGKVDIMWYDVNWPLIAEEWESAKLNSMVRELQPDILINDRSGLPEDFGTPEQHITPEKSGRAWEACMTLTENCWGYSPIDNRYKDARTVVDMLRQVAAGGGNLLLNIGPAPDGSVPGPCVSTLIETGDWLSEYGPTVFEASDKFQQEWWITGAFTKSGQKLFYHVVRWPGEELAIGGVHSKVISARFFGGPEISFTQDGDRLVMRGLPTLAPNSTDTVIELEIEGEPRLKHGAGCVMIEKDPWG